MYTFIWNGNESENPFLISNFTKNYIFFFENDKNHFSGKKNSWTAYKNNFEFKELKLLENHS